MYKTFINIIQIDGTQDQLILSDRPHQKGVNEQLILTDQFYKRIDEMEFAQQRVQAIVFNKYEIRNVSFEDHYLELIKYAKSVEVLSYDKSVIHNARILDISREKIADTDFTNVTITYYDINLDNYKYREPAVINYLRSDALAELPFASRNVLRVQDGSNVYDFNSMLDITKKGSAPERQSFNNTQDGSIITTNTIIRQQFDLVFYLNGQDAEIFSTRLPLADGWDIKGYYFSSNVGYQMAQASDVTLEMIDGWDIYKGTLSFVYNNINHFSHVPN